MTEMAEFQPHFKEEEEYSKFEGGGAGRRLRKGSEGLNPLTSLQPGLPTSKTIMEK